MYTACAHQNLGMGFDQGSELHRKSILKAQVFSVWPVAHEDRISAITDRSIHIGSQNRAVRHREGYIPFDDHAPGFCDLPASGTGIGREW
jgi:hypothetical protein